MTPSEAGKLGAIKSAQIQKEQKALRIHEYNKNPNKCKFCGQSFSYEKRHNKFCDQSCTASYNNKLTKIKLKEQNYCLNCGNKIPVNRKYCSNKCQGEFKIKQKFENIEETGIFPFSAKINEKIRNALKGRIYRKPRKCIICNKEIPMHKKGKTCCIECEKQYKKIRHVPAGGGYRQGSSRGHHGYYKGYWCDSTYELAYLIYCLDHNIKIERCKESFEYEIDGKKHKYHPDFIINDEIIEIKNFHRDDVEIKINAVKKLNRKIKVLYYEDLIEIFEYVAKTYKKEFKNKSNNFYELYEK